MNEGEFKRPLIRELVEIGALHFHIVGGLRQESGWPDSYITHWKWSGFVEWKGTATVVKPKQAYTIREINKRNPYTAFVVRAPGLIQNENGHTFCQFSGARELLEKLVEVRNYMRGQNKSS